MRWKQDRIQFRSMRSCLVAFAILLTLFLSSRLHAQTATGEIAGTVRDATGGVLPGVKLTIAHQGSGQERTLTTDSNGNYAVPALPIGEYSIKAELTDFKTQVRQGIVLQVGRHAQVDVVMEVGEINEAITIDESGPMLQTAN